MLHAVPPVWQVPLLVAAAYALGSLSPGWWLVRRQAGVDLRNEGSGATGATNAARVLGKKAYAWVLILDTLKGFAAVLAARWLAPRLAVGGAGRPGGRGRAHLADLAALPGRPRRLHSDGRLFRLPLGHCSAGLDPRLYFASVSEQMVYR